MIGQEKEKFGGCKHLLPILKVREKHGNELCFDTYFMVRTFFPKIELPFPTFSMVVKNIHTFSKLKKKNIVFKVTSKFFSYCSFICCTLKMTLIRFLKEINYRKGFKNFVHQFGQINSKIERNSIQFTLFTNFCLENDTRNQNKSFSQNEVSELLSKYCTEHGLFGQRIPSRLRLFSLEYFD